MTDTTDPIEPSEGAEPLDSTYDEAPVGGADVTDDDDYEFYGEDDETQDQAPAHAPDPVTRVLLVVALSVIVVLLATAGVLFYYLGTLNKAPRTITERDVTAGETLTREKPKDATAWMNLAYAYSDAGRFDDALATIDKGMRSSKEPTLILVKADVLRVAGRYKEALDSYDEAEVAVKAALKKIKEDREKVGVRMKDDGKVISRVYFGRALTNQKLGDAKAALKDLERAVAANPQQVNVSVALGDAYLESGQTAKAEKAYRDALKYVPDYAGALEGLQRIKEGK